MVKPVPLLPVMSIGPSGCASTNERTGLNPDIVEFFPFQNTSFAFVSVTD
jgi:hypothetical protein